MCTVTVIDLPDAGWRVACNRDELRSRPPATPPTVSEVHGTAALFPRDNPSGGTWLGVNPFGLVATLLNVNPFEPVEMPADAPSRGEIIPLLLDAENVPAALRSIAEHGLTAYAPFRLVLLDDTHVVTVRQLRGAVDISPLEPRDRPLMYTSSGLGDHLVEGQRTDLFREWSRQRWNAARQDAFHAHSWEEWPELSVNMSRTDACTVSFATVTVTSEQVTMDYHAGAPHVAGKETQHQMARRRGGA